MQMNEEYALWDKNGRQIRQEMNPTIPILCINKAFRDSQAISSVSFIINRRQDSRVINTE